MDIRSAARLSGLLLVLAAVGCSDDGYTTTDVSNLFEIDPPYAGAEAGQTQQFTATLGGDPVAVTWESSDPSIATVSSTGLVSTLNAGFVAITAAQTANPSVIKSASLTIIPGPILLTSGVPVTGIGGDIGDLIRYRVNVPAGATNLVIQMSGGTGDLDLHVRYGQMPTLATFDCRPYAGGNNETCTFPNPTAGVWFILLDVYDDATGVSLVATVSP